MNEVVIGIIGGTGGMGRWFADLLISEGFAVHVCGRKTTLGVYDLAKLCNVIVVSVPISATAEMIRQVGPMLDESKLLMDLTSLKKEPVELMLANTKAEVIGCHPLFGPSLPDAAGQNFVLCPARGSRWLPWLKSILDKNGLNVLTITPDEHDRMMAIVQVLNHLNTMTLGLALSQMKIPLEEINKYSTPIFQTKIEIVKKIFTDNPALYTDIITQNPGTGEILDLYEKALTDIRALVQSSDGTKLKEAIELAAKKLF